MVVLTLPFRKHERDVWRDISLALLLSGVLGNLTDRLHYGAVIDFLLFNLHVPFANPWPASNVAEACICIAVGFFMVHSFRQEKRCARYRRDSAATGNGDTGERRRKITASPTSSFVVTTEDSRRRVFGRTRPAAPRSPPAYANGKFSHFRPGKLATFRCGAPFRA